MKTLTDKIVRPLKLKLSELELAWNIRKDPGNAYYFESIAKGAQFVMIGNGGTTVSDERKRFVGTSKNWKSAYEMFKGWHREAPILFLVEGDDLTVVAGVITYKDESKRIQLAKTRLDLHNRGIISLSKYDFQQDYSLINPPPAPERMILVKESEHLALKVVAKAAAAFNNIEFTMDGKFTQNPDPMALHSAIGNLDRLKKSVEQLEKVEGGGK